MKGKLCFLHVLLIVQITMAVGCGPRLQSDVSASPLASQTRQTDSAPPPASTAPSATDTPFPTSSPTSKPSATWTPSPTITSSPTQTTAPETITAMVLVQANCRYGPGKAYLYSHGLYAGDTAVIDGRNYSGSWVWIKPSNLERHCWAAVSVLDTAADLLRLPVVQSRLPQSTLYGPPQRIDAARSGSIVIISWESVWMTKDDYRGYLIEAVICKDGSLIPFAMHVDGTRAEVPDEPGCTGTSSGKLYSVEKHGYTIPAIIPWP